MKWFYDFVVDLTDEFELAGGCNELGNNTYNAIHIRDDRLYTTCIRG